MLVYLGVLNLKIFIGGVHVRQWKNLSSAEKKRALFKRTGDLLFLSRCGMGIKA